MPGGVPSAVPAQRPVAGLHRARPAAPRCGTSTATSTSTSTTASASCASATPTRSSPPPSRRRWTRARTSPRPPRARSSSPRSSSRRWGLPHWRFTNSGTESTMDAVHLARGATGRDVIVKIEGTYHGHHDAVMVSVKPPADLMGDRERPAAIPYGLGYAPRRRAEADARRPVQRRRGGSSACSTSSRARSPALILEPAMMNINIVPPVDGYLERVRELTHAARRAADLRRGQDRRGGRRRRRDRAVRRHARHRLPGEGDLRRAARRRDRHDRRARRARGVERASASRARSTATRW